MTEGYELEITADQQMAIEMRLASPDGRRDRQAMMARIAALPDAIGILEINLDGTGRFDVVRIDDLQALPEVD